MNHQNINLPEVFTPEERDENKEQKRKLTELVASGEAVLFVGAGSSKRLGYPDWLELIQELNNLANKYEKSIPFHLLTYNYIINLFRYMTKFLKSCLDFKNKKNSKHDILSELSEGFKHNNGKRQGNLLADAQEMKTHILKHKGGETKYNALFQELFDIENKDLPYDKFHEILVSLPLRGIITTNYDKALETALESLQPSPKINRSLIIKEDSPWDVEKFIEALNNLQLPRRIAHLHGRYDYPESIILSTDDYKRTYGSVSETTPEFENSRKGSHWKKFFTNQNKENMGQKLIQKLLWSVFATRRVVFIGFSMKDPYLNAILDSVSQDLWRQNKTVHFVVTGITVKSSDDSKEKARIWKEKYGIDTVFYEIINNSHQGLDHQGLDHQGLDHLIDEIAETCGIKIKSQIEDFNWLRTRKQTNGMGK